MGLQPAFPPASPIMPLNGDLSANALYVSLKFRPLRNEYHWGLILVDDDRPILHHANNHEGSWSYEKRSAHPESSLTLICLVKISDVASQRQAKSVIASVPADGEPSARTTEAFTCRIWVKDVLVALHNGGIIQLTLDIDDLEDVIKDWGGHYADYAELGEAPLLSIYLLTFDQRQHV